MSSTRLDAFAGAVHTQRTLFSAAVDDLRPARCRGLPPRPERRGVPRTALGGERRTRRRCRHPRGPGRAGRPLDPGERRGPARAARGPAGRDHRGRPRRRPVVPGDPRRIGYRRGHGSRRCAALAAHLGQDRPPARRRAGGPAQLRTAGRGPRPARVHAAAARGQGGGHRCRGAARRARHRSGRGRPGRRGPGRRAPRRPRSRRRPGGRTQRHLRCLREPRAPQPAAAAPSARAAGHHGTPYRGPGRTGGPLPARPPHHPHAPARREPDHPLRRRPRTRLAPPGAAAGRGARGGRRGRGLPAGRGALRRRDAAASAARSPTSPTCWPNWSRTR